MNSGGLSASKCINRIFYNVNIYKSRERSTNFLRINRIFYNVNPDFYLK